MRALLRKLMRYAAVSVISTTVSLTVLGVLVGTAAMSAGWANVIATAVGTIPSFELNRRWVWGKRDERSLVAEIAPFCALSFLGLGLCTLAVSIAATWAARAGLGNTLRVAVADAANVATFGSLWVAQYVILDRLLFKHAESRRLAVSPVGTTAETTNSAARPLEAA
jgi:putative flippase GtrA